MKHTVRSQTMPHVRRTRRPSPRKLIDHAKANGVYYTPPDLAAFLAGCLYRHTVIPSDGTIRVLDPACGDGSLLRAFAQVVPPGVRSRLRLTGYDTDEAALAKASANLKELETPATDLRKTDFLSLPESQPQREASLFDVLHRGSSFPDRQPQYDVVIANPPYVRTQVLGAERAQQLAATYDLSGRVDLYHAFIKAIAAVLRTGGTLGLLTSNRFLYTQAGAATREALLRDFQLCQLVDLGDTKLFSAAVLPAIVIARRSPVGHSGRCPFTRIYEVRDPNDGHTIRMTHPSVLVAVEQDAQDMVAIGPTHFNIERGAVALSSSPKHPWRLSSEHLDNWLATLSRNTQYRFAELAKVRVGIKTTADEVFIREDWDRLPEEETPEPELLRPLLRSYMADRWCPAVKQTNAPRVLYPHAIEHGRRVAVNLSRYPRARSYLERHRERLTSRRYVIEGGRQWYEIWVPQNPADWSKDKIVFPDISEEPRFFLDKETSIVNGDCYWITLLPGQDPRWLTLMLAVANSSMILKYYDAVFGNKLYAGRRRFITQYVQRFPLPRLDHPATSQIIALVPELTNAGPDRAALRPLEERVDELVWEAFGLVKEVAG